MRGQTAGCEEDHLGLQQLLSTTNQARFKQLYSSFLSGRDEASGMCDESFKASAGLKSSVLDLNLLCANNETVLVRSKLLIKATRSDAIEDILLQLLAGHPHASADQPMMLPVPEDSAAEWRVVWSLVENPMAEGSGLTWANLERVIKLADKYALLPALQACEAFILAALGDGAPQAFPAADMVQCAFGYLSFGGQRFNLQLPFLGLLCKLQMTKAYTALAPQYGRVLRSECAEVKEVRSRHIKAQAKGVAYPTYGDVQPAINQATTRLKAVSDALITFLAGSSEAGVCVARLVQDQVNQAIAELAAA